ncbi:nucleotidyltransferase family protein [Clostridium sp. HBUAS56017]|uniref:nucleotidyltransferase family protein n=1 Tax=Clostridium sp. HBUAS56017 TaxID=2571128 RepID=UPI001177BF59|nr:nucleotidyltransferase family protein [Clostridium sp. HBUAS56017]
MNEIDRLYVNESLNLRNVLKQIDANGRKIVFVVNDKGKFLGTITDGDVRRWILKNGSIDAIASEVMNDNSIVLFESKREEAKKILKKKNIIAIPIVNKERKIVDIVFSSEYLGYVKSSLGLKDISIIIMAGGLGTRLHPYTKILPKPLIPIGDTPILERIINRFTYYGANKFYLTVNYKKNMIKSYFNELDVEYSISYVEESEPLGTGGSLSLLKGKIGKTFFVSNCDILIDAEYDDILKHHRNSGNKITIVTSVKNFIIPYGVFKLNEDGCISEVYEKPEYSYLVNTGMYVLEPEVLNDIPYGQYCNLPDVIKSYIKENIKVGIYPISEQAWMDMGQLSEMKDMVERIEEKEGYNK